MHTCYVVTVMKACHPLGGLPASPKKHSPWKELCDLRLPPKPYFIRSHQDQNRGIVEAELFVRARATGPFRGGPVDALPPPTFPWPSLSAM